MSCNLTRRALLGGTFAAGGALFGRPVRAAAAAKAGRFFAQPDLDFSVSFAIGESAYGASETGEVLAAIDRINAAGASYQTYVDEFRSLARRLSAESDAALHKGHRATARAASLRASHSFKQALYFVLGTSKPDDEAVLYRETETQWARAASLLDPPFERVEIPYEGSSLPAYFRRAGEKRPSIILNNGSDAQNIDLWAYGAAAAHDRGYNVLIFEGPGQGAMLFERRIVFRPDWERVLTPVVDFLVRRNDVDAKRIGVIGWSMGGALVARAAAFEPRIAAVCCDPGVGDAWDSFPEILRHIADAGDAATVNQIWRTQVIRDLSPAERFTIMKRCSMFSPKFHEAALRGEVSDDFDSLAKAVQRFKSLDVMDRIRAPLLVTSYENEHTNPPGTAQRVFDAARAPKKFLAFTAAEGAGEHDAPFAPQRRNAAILDWFDETLG
ncbi:MAG TPA: alpha/beta fold hydrolase [Thermoanaerobaculia bacterium]|nr:alpha/beta fold hydrolase [Thermoanaerobaculia bacterium]